MLNRRSHGVFVSERPLEEEEDEIDEETSVDGLEDVENSSMKMTRVTLFWRKTKSECVETKTTRNIKERDYVKGLAGSRDAEIPRGSGRVETENEMQPMWQCGTMGKRMSTKIVTRLQRKWKRKPTLEEK